MNQICGRCAMKGDDQWGTNKTEARLRVTVTLIRSGTSSEVALCEWCAQHQLGLVLDGVALLTVEPL